MTVGAGKSDVYEAAYLEFFFFGTAIPNLPVATTGDFYIALYTADPTEEATNPATSEASYTGYARKSIKRTSGSTGWTRTGNQVSNTAQQDFAACTAGSSTVTHFALVSSSSGAGTLFYVGALGSALAIGVGVTPSIAAGALVFTEN